MGEPNADYAWIRRPTRGLCDEVARHAWKHDGEPDSDGEYRDMARVILGSLAALGYRIAKPAAAPVDGEG